MRSFIHQLTIPSFTGPFRSLTRALALGLCMIGLTGCASVYYDSMERKGFEKRDILVERVKDARAEQAQAQLVFSAALDEFRALATIHGGALEPQYDKMKASYEGSVLQAGAVRKRIDAVDDVAKRLFREWRGELTLYESTSLRQRSADQLSTTQRDYNQLLGAMNNAADKMQPVLALYRDQVLFLKHNLNARAISSLALERTEIEARVEILIKEMNTAIAEADAFIASME